MPYDADILPFALNLARAAGELIVRERDNSQLNRSYKQDNELVTQVDLLADQFICERIADRFPNQLILSEESSPDFGNPAEQDRPVWIIDPIDGTVNFAHGHIQSAISIAHVADGEVEVGVVFNPFTDEMFHAVRGGGAFLNDRPIRVSAETDLKRALIATGFPYKKEGLEVMTKRLHAVLTHCADIRRLGSAALDICWLAAGRLDGYYESLSLWDHAAAALVAREAGAEHGHFSKVPEGTHPHFHSEDIVIANPSLYGRLRKLLIAASEG